MRILVTGGGGMVGSYLKDLAKEYKEHEFLAMTRSDCARVMGIEEKSIVFETSMSDGCLRKTVDNSKLLKLYPNFRFKSLEDGLKITYDWFKVRYPDVRQ